MALSREFDYPERFEREKVTRLMPETLRVMGMYTLRMMLPPGERPFAFEFATAITVIQPQGEGTHVIEWVWQLPKDPKPKHEGGMFNARGFMIMDNSDQYYPGFPPEIEMAYFVGSTDPYDLELAELTAEEERALTSVV
jgi:hypothetical protein